jgi:hypothetical protein
MKNTSAEAANRITIMIIVIKIGFILIYLCFMTLILPKDSTPKTVNDQISFFNTFYSALIFLEASSCPPASG